MSLPTDEAEQLHIRIPTALHAKLRRIAKSESMPIRALVTQMVTQAVNARREREESEEDKRRQKRKERDAERREHPGLLGGRLRERLMGGGVDAREKDDDDEPAPRAATVVNVGSGTNGPNVPGLAAWIAKLPAGHERDKRVKAAIEILKCSAPESEHETLAQALDDAVEHHDKQRAAPRAGSALENLRKTLFGGTAKK